MYDEQFSREPFLLRLRGHKDNSSEGYTFCENRPYDDSRV